MCKILGLGFFYYKDHVKMNVCILGDAMAVQRQNYQIKIVIVGIES
jgi:hypothetical protein